MALGRWTAKHRRSLLLAQVLRFQEASKAIKANKIRRFWATLALLKRSQAHQAGHRSPRASSRLIVNGRQGRVLQMWELAGSMWLHMATRENLAGQALEGGTLAAGALSCLHHGSEVVIFCKGPAWDVRLGSAARPQQRLGSWPSLQGACEFLKILVSQAMRKVEQTQTTV